MMGRYHSPKPSVTSLESSTPPEPPPNVGRGKIDRETEKSARSGIVGLTEFHSQTRHPCQASLLVAGVSDGIGQWREHVTFLLCMVDLLGPGRHFIPRPAVNNSHAFRPKAHSRPCRVHSDITGTQNDDVLAARNRCVNFWILKDCQSPPMMVNAKAF